MPMAAAAPVVVLMPISWSASPRVWVMSSPGRASEPTAMIQTTSGLTSTLVALLIFTRARSVGFTEDEGASVAQRATTTPRAASRVARQSRVFTGPPPGRRRNRRPATRPCPSPGRGRRGPASTARARPWCRTRGRSARSPRASGPSTANTSTRTRRRVAVALSIWSAIAALVRRSRSRWASSAAPGVKLANAAAKSLRGKSPRKAPSKNGSTTSVMLFFSRSRWVSSSLLPTFWSVVAVVTSGTSTALSDVDGASSCSPLMSSPESQPASGASSSTATALTSADRVRRRRRRVTDHGDSLTCRAASAR